MLKSANMASEHLVTLDVRPDYKKNLYFMKGGDVWAYAKVAEAPLAGGHMVAEAPLAGGHIDTSKYMYFLKAGDDGFLAVFRRVRGGKKKTAT